MFILIGATSSLMGKRSFNVKDIVVLWRCVEIYVPIYVPTLLRFIAFLLWFRLNCASLVEH